MTFRLLPAGIEESQFKREPDGWLFTIANPWIFGRRWTYLVNDEQKAVLAAGVRRARYVRLVVMFLMMLLLVGLIVLMPSLLRPASIGPWMVLAGFVFVFSGALFVSDYLTVRPLLHGIPRTARKLSYLDMMRGQYNAMSVRALSIFVAIFAFAVIAQGGDFLVSQRIDALRAVSTIGFALFGVMFAGMLIAKLRARRVTGVE